MDVSHVEDSVTDDHEKFSAVHTQHACGVSEVDPIQELEKALHDTLVVKGESLETGSNWASNEDGDGGGGGSSSSSSSSPEEKITDSGDSDLDQECSIATSSKCLHKCATFPTSVTNETSDECQLGNKRCTRSESLPTERCKIVSAMKGSREREGVPQRKLSVSWAPDVYDPPPTSVSHHPKKKAQQQFKGNKKHGKGKHKGKALRGGGSGPKDKKHYRKTGGRSDRCLDSFAETDRVLSSKNYNSFDLLDFNDDLDIGIGSPDTNCGTSFLQAGGAMHCVC